MRSSIVVSTAELHLSMQYGARLFALKLGRAPNADIFKPCMQPEVYPARAQPWAAEVRPCLCLSAGRRMHNFVLQQLALAAPGGGGMLLRRGARPGVWELVGERGVELRTPARRRGGSGAARARMWEAVLPELARAGLRPVAAAYARAPQV